MAATKKKPAAKRGGALPRWTPEDIAKLEAAVKTAKSRSEAFQSVAAELGKSAGTVQQKWYQLQRKKSKRAARSVAVRRGSVPARQASGKYAQMSSSELLVIAREVRAEIDRRQSELAEAKHIFG